MGFIRGFDWEGEDKSAAMAYLTPKLRVRLTDPDKHPVAGGKCRLTEDPGAEFDCDEHGIAEIPLADRGRKTVEVEWEGAGAAGGDPEDRFPWSNVFDVEIQSAQDGDCGKRLSHLGFDGDDLSCKVLGYQAYFGLSGLGVTGNLGDIRDQLVRWHDGGERPAGGTLDGTSGARPMGGGSKKRTRKVLLVEHDEHDWDRIEAAIERHPDFEFEGVDEASPDEIMDAMKSAKPGDIFVFEGHTYSEVLGGPVEGVTGENWLGSAVKVPLKDIRKALGGTPPSVAVFAGCNSNEIFPTALAAGVKVVFGIENVVRNTISDFINGSIADRVAAHLIDGRTLRETMDLVNDWLDGQPLNNGNRVACDSETGIDLDLNMEDNGL